MSKFSITGLSADEQERVSSTLSAIDSYLKKSEDLYLPGQDCFFAQHALAQAAAAVRVGNYAIGAVLVDACSHDKISVYYGHNCMFNPPPDLITAGGKFARAILPLTGHAEAAAIFRHALGVAPDRVFQRGENKYLSEIPRGVSIYGTLEPCPMCTSIMTNCVSVIRSVSTHLDLPSAYAITHRVQKQPPIWTEIQDTKGLHFEKLSGGDSELLDLTATLFSITREPIDRMRAARTVCSE